jgi:hypothetical protein
LLSRKTLTGVVIIWLICLSILSLQPERIAGVAQGSFRPHQIMHILVFGVTLILTAALARNPRQEWLAVAGIVVLAVLLELGQWQIYRFQYFEWWDVREDWIGCLLGLMAIRFTRTRQLILNGAVERT